jgi:hypothetical protein
MSWVLLGVLQIMAVDEEVDTGTNQAIVMVMAM